MKSSLLVVLAILIFGLTGCYIEPIRRGDSSSRGSYPYGPKREYPDDRVIPENREYPDENPAPQDREAPDDSRYSSVRKEPDYSVKPMEQLTQTVFCESREECDDKWDKTMRWMGDNTTLQIRTHTDSLISTEGPYNDPNPAFQAQMLPNGNQEKIVMIMKCGSSLGCRPALAELKDNYLNFVNAYQPPAPPPPPVKPEPEKRVYTEPQPPQSQPQYQPPSQGPMLSRQAEDLARQFGEQCADEFDNTNDQIQCVIAQCQNSFTGRFQSACTEEGLAAIGFDRSDEPDGPDMQGMSAPSDIPPPQDMQEPPSRDMYARSDEPEEDDMPPPPPPAPEKKPDVKPAPSRNENPRFAKAENYFEQKKYEQAILEFQKFIDENPKDPDVASAMLQQAYALLNLKRDEEAAIFFHSLIDKFPKSEEADLARIELKDLEPKR